MLIVHNTSNYLNILNEYFIIYKLIYLNNVLNKKYLFCIIIKINLFFKSCKLL